MPLVVGLLALVAIGGHQMTLPLISVENAPVPLDPWMLPDYALRSTLRMLLLPGPVSRQRVGRGVRRDLRHLHQPGLEHGLQPYQSLRTVPRDLDEAAAGFGLSG